MKLTYVFFPWYLNICLFQLHVFNEDPFLFKFNLLKYFVKVGSASISIQALNGPYYMWINK